MIRGLSFQIRKADNSACQYPTSRIQKGLLLGYQNQDLSGEGVGFGIPILKRQQETFFPGDGDIKTHKIGDATVIQVNFDLNLVERKKVSAKRRIESWPFYRTNEFFSKLHRKNRLARKVLKYAAPIIQNVLGIRTEFVECQSAGIVNVVYNISDSLSKIEVAMDFREINKYPPAEVFIMNEQSGKVFNNYRDSAGTNLDGGEIGTWDEVFASEAMFIDYREKLFFRLKQDLRARMFRGRELDSSRLAWAGLAYLLKNRINQFTYEINLGIGL